MQPALFQILNETPEREQQKVADVHGAEIDMVATWTKAVAQNLGISIDLSTKLID